MGKRVAACALFVICVPLLFAAVYYLALFIPRQDRPRQFLTSHGRTCGPVTERLSALLTVSEGDDGVAFTLVSAMVHESALDFRRFAGIDLGMLGWHLNARAWIQMIRMHYSEGERVALWCHYYWGRVSDGELKHGLEQVSQAKFGKAPEQLTNLELAQLVLAMRHPAHAWDSPERLKQAAEGLVKKVENEI